MTYRVSFYWGEAPMLGLPDALTERVTPHIACMAGTNARRPRCAALGTGTAGPMACGVYERRPSPCHELQAGDDKCERARARHGLAPLRPPLDLSIDVIEHQGRA